jgi:hypothetical protein
MKRRDLLRHAGAVALALPAARTAKAFQSSTGRDLLVTLSGPFCYWQESDYLKVMAPPVGTDSNVAPHQAWIGTHANEKKMSSVTVKDPPKYEVSIPGRSTFPPPVGTPSFSYWQGTAAGKPPLFNLWLPFPDQIIGVRPTSVSFGQNQSTYKIFAASWMCLYRNVEWDKVKVKIGGERFFKPCFTNDELLPMASLGFFLTPLNQHPDRGHVQAMHVWTKMLSMYPWMQSEFEPIAFDPSFDPAKCMEPAEQSSQGSPQPPMRVAVGPGNDCEVPIMWLQAGGPAKKG